MKEDIWKNSILTTYCDPCDVFTIDLTKGESRCVGEQCSMNTRDFITVSKPMSRSNGYARITLAIDDCVCICVCVSWPKEAYNYQLLSDLLRNAIKTSDSRSAFRGSAFESLCWFFLIFSLYKYFIICCAEIKNN